MTLNMTTVFFYIYTDLFSCYLPISVPSFTGLANMASNFTLYTLQLRTVFIVGWINNRKYCC